MTTPRASPDVIGATAAPTSALLMVRHLTVRTASGRTLVRDLDFDLNRGETVGVVGESGSGKTMTARAVMRAVPGNVRSEGQILFDGLDLQGRSARQLRPIRGTRISMVLQDPFTSLNPLQTIGEHIRESLPRAVRRDRVLARAETARRLEEVGLRPTEATGKYPFQLSGGMRQRAALAAALAADPELLIADEPTTALDVTTQAEILALLANLQRERNMALMLITHDLRVAFSVCDRVLVMYAGSIVEDADARTIARRPEHPYTVGLLGAEPPLSHYAPTLASIPGNVPAPDSVTDRCAFASRCRWAAGECTQTRPAMTEVGDHHRTACRRIEAIRPELRAAQLEVDAVSAQPEPSAGKPLLAVTDLVKTFRTSTLVGRAREVTAVERVSFDVAAGESVGLVGETGSGKTTIARCILGLDRPDAGAITISGIDTSRYRKLSRAQRADVRRLVQVVFQDPYSSLNPALTVGAALSEAITARGQRADLRREVGELLTMVGLSDRYAERRPGALSGGERQRVAIARALAVRPQLLICDEPVAALDVSVQAQILEVLRAARSRYNMSMLFITHDLSVVRQMTERAVVLQHGQVVEAAPTATLLDHPQHPYTIRLVESVPTDGDRTKSLARPS